MFDYFWKGHNFEADHGDNAELKIMAVSKETSLSKTYKMQKIKRFHTEIN